MIFKWQEILAVLWLHSSAQGQFSGAMQVALVGQAKYVAYELQAVCILAAQTPHQLARLTTMLYTFNLKQSTGRSRGDIAPVSGWLPCFGALFYAMAVRSNIHYPNFDVKTLLTVKWQPAYASAAQVYQQTIKHGRSLLPGQGICRKPSTANGCVAGHLCPSISSRDHYTIL